MSQMYVDGSYLESNPTWHVEDSPWKAEQISAILSKNKITPSTICEVGCGAGEILRQLSIRMPDAFFSGFELSPQAFELCKMRTSERLQFVQDDVTTSDVFFDLMLCIDVLEHVEDYIGFLKKLRCKAIHKVFHIPLDISVLSVLRGSMMITRKSFGHLHYFTPETALETLRYCNYEIIDFFYTAWFADLPSNTVTAKIARLPRKLLYTVSPDLFVKLSGGCSLMVLSK